MKQTYKIAIVLLCLFFEVRAEVFNGLIVDADTNTPLPYCMVKSIKVDLGALANDEGRFSINTQHGDSLLITYTGYEDRVLSVIDITSDSVISLKPKLFVLNNLVVTPKSKPKHKTFGKNHASGAVQCLYDLEPGASIGVSVKAPNKKTWLTPWDFMPINIQKLSPDIKCRLMFMIYPRLRGLFPQISKMC